ncbi:hypothetical protein QU818_23525, partial [Escherichia coli]|nr:hypothetical protein [Escherichia coli]
HPSVCRVADARPGIPGEFTCRAAGALTGVHTTAANLDIRIPYATDPAGNRLPDPELHPDSTLSMWPDNRIARDA